MRVLKNTDVDKSIRLYRETEGRQPLLAWIMGSCYYAEEYVEESIKRFPDGLTYDEAFQFLEDK